MDCGAASVHARICDKQAALGFDVQIRLNG
jgi:hypothetical protein